MKKNKKKIETKSLPIAQEFALSLALRLYSALKKEFSRKWLFYFILLLSIPSIFFLTKGILLFPDGIGYFSYTRSLVMDQNLLFANDLKLSGVSDKSLYFHSTHDDYISNPFAIGTGLVWIPFFLAGHLFVILLKILLNLPLLSDGSSFFYTFACSLESCLIGLFSLLISFKIARRFFSDRDCLLAMLGIWFASPFFFCFYWMPTHSHLIDAFAIALFLWMWIESKDKDRWLWWVCFGLSFGFAILVRWQNILLGMLLLIPPKINRKAISFYSAFLLGSLLVFSPQFIAWKIIYEDFLLIPQGEEVYRESLLIPQGEGYMRWAHPEILRFLFSSWHGFYSWTPILIFSTIGLFLLYKRDRRMAIGSLLILLMQIYVNSCATDWHAGISFGARRMTGLTPIFVIGLASFLSLFSGRKRVVKYLLVGIASFSALILVISMLNCPDYLGDYHSYPELMNIQLKTLFNLKEMLPSLISFGSLRMLDEYQANEQLFFSLKVFYATFGILFFFLLKIGYEAIMENNKTSSPQR
jgi:hypothetical protein